MYELCFVFINCALIPFLDSALWLVAEGLATGYIDAREHSGGERHFDVDWSPIIEDLYSPELGNPLGCRGSACVEVMTTLHGSARLFGDVQRVAYRRRRRRLSGSDFDHSLDTPSWVRVEGRLVRYSERQYGSAGCYCGQFTAAMASIQEALASLRQEIGGQQGRPPAVAQDETPHDSLPPPPPPPIPSAPQASPYILHGHSEIAPP
ncbi:hypothetical protein CK203_099193 [Vitis vinifera]|uniref:Uncharacterized protein n=1 Tax=Vitis vinifera TaxID=29760 RepID=A0A438DMP6_VITVI|nr:hypothetical protein CK203_099193 [Vitis vinifera]